MVFYSKNLACIDNYIFFLVTLLQFTNYCQSFSSFAVNFGLRNYFFTHILAKYTIFGLFFFQLILLYQSFADKFSSKVVKPVKELSFF